MLFSCIQVGAYSSNFFNIVDLCLRSSNYVGNDMVGNVRHVNENNWMTGVNFINILHAAFAPIDPKSVKRYWRLDLILTLLGAMCVKAPCKHVGEINPLVVKKEFSINLHPFWTILKKVFTTRVTCCIEINRNWSVLIRCQVFRRRRGVNFPNFLEADIF